MAAQSGLMPPVPHQEAQAQDQAPVVVETVDSGHGNGYQIVRSQTGRNYVQADEYDPLGHHRSRDPNANKGQGLGFMFCCCQPAADEQQPSKVDRHYSTGPATPTKQGAQQAQQAAASS